MISYPSAEDFLQPLQREGLQSAWNTSLRHLLPAVPDYELVKEEVQALLPAWIPKRGEP